jgi:hypothetical protein
MLDRYLGILDVDQVLLRVPLLLHDVPPSFISLRRYAER